MLSRLPRFQTRHGEPAGRSTVTLFRSLNPLNRPTVPLPVDPMKTLRPYSTESLALLRSLVERHGISASRAALDTLADERFSPTGQADVPASLSTVLSRDGRVWVWDVFRSGVHVGGGYGRTKRDAASDASIFVRSRRA